MKIIGITGGVGAGKSTVLNILEELCSCKVVMADDVAKELMQYGKALSKLAIDLFGQESYKEDRSLNTAHIAALMYNDDVLKNKWTGAVHPAVKKEILFQIENAKALEEVDYFFLEAALLLEEKYDEICDEIWYVYADEAVRIERIMTNRGYSLEKAKNIISSQKTHEEFLLGSQWVIDNGISIAKTRIQLENKLEELEKV